ncbi:outer membrane efflux protein [mine drainage metagenome]|uniref:Outer membrane efflux protein n=1 Tax=mine drainage metagenome TaxID=410659 RepID=A0A1J5SW03_9ZZZZ
MKIKINAILLLAGGMFFCVQLKSQNILEQYVKLGLDSNLAVKQKNFDLKKAKLDLQRAEALFYPQVNFASQYTAANGGRSSDLPIGDLLNGVYSTLNKLTATNNFPQVSNQTINFLPNDFHDTRFEVLIPLVNTDIKYNKQIKSELINTQQQDVLLYKRELVKMIKQAYYQYLQADKALNIYENALNSVNENLRLNEKLVKNNVATKEVIARAKTQVSQVETSIIEATNNKKNALAYFNFLLNQPLETPVNIDSSLLQHLQIKLTVPLEVPVQREELAKLQSVKKVYSTNLKLTDATKIPKLNAAYNIGFQGNGFTFDNKQFYQLAAVQLQWNLFKGFDNRYKIKQSQIDIDAIQNQYNDVQKQMLLQVSTANNTYLSAWAALKSTSDEVQSSKEVYEFTEKRYKEGQALLIELTDARTQMTNAAIKYSLAQLAVLNREAELERVTASYPLN